MAKTSGVVNATNINIFKVVEGTHTKIAEITSASLNLTHSARETTSNASGGWTTRAKGRLDWEMSGSALFRFDAAYGFADLEALYENNAELLIIWKSENNEDEKFRGTGVLTSLQATGSSDENETYSFTFQGKGELQMLFAPTEIVAGAAGDYVRVYVPYAITNGTGQQAKFIGTYVFEGQSETFYVSSTTYNASGYLNLAVADSNLDPDTIPLLAENIVLTYQPSGADIVSAEGFVLTRFVDFPASNQIVP